MEPRRLVPACKAWAESCVPRWQPSRFAALFRRSKWFMIVSVGIVAIGTTLAVFPPRETSYAEEADCLFILASISHVTNFPLPFPIDGEKHESTLKELDRPGMFGELVYSRSAVRSALTTTAENLVAFINQGAQDYSRLPSEEAVKAFRYDSNVILRQLQQALHTIDRLAAVYDEVKDDYYWYDADTAKAYEQGQLSTGHKLQLYGRSTVMRTFFGINVNQLYLAPLNEKERKRTEARRALVAWKRDTQRLDQIREVIWEVDRSLQRFANSLPSGVDNPRNSLHNPRAKTTTGQGWLREFHRQEKVENHRLKHAWNKLLESVSNEEEKVELEIQPKLCSRVKAPEWERPNEITTSAIYIIPFAFLAKTPTGQVPDSSVFDPSRPTHPMPSIRPLHCCLPHWGGRPSKQLEPPPREQE